ncbi:MAG TPA: hypothetical protein VFJ51_09165 [Nitrososphaeraceae archaeon]|nr:hypothetical protein [Nitrososphaeraceae archaeon]
MKVQWKKRTEIGYIKVKVPTHQSVEEMVLEPVVVGEIGRSLTKEK